VRQLKKINLTNAEWDTIKDFFPVLKLFTDAIEFLGGSNYSTISFIFYVISILASDLALDTVNNSVMINFELSATAFNNNIIYEDADEEIDEINNGTQRIRINTPKNCDRLIKRIKTALNKSLHHYYSVPSEVGMLAALLDPQCKSLNFKNNQERFSTIIKFARKYLSIPKTSTSSERLFSYTKNIMSSKYTNLKPQ
ncbi:2202_t:CDS:2, partial [Scutellospora calospora]